MNAVQAALDAGKFYANEVKDFVADRLGITPEQRAFNKTRVEGGDFGYEVYLARQVVEGRQRDDKLQAATRALNLKPGDQIGALVFNNDFKRNTGMKVVSVDGDSVVLEGKRGSRTIQQRTDSLGVLKGIDRAKEKGYRPDSADEFIAGRPKQSTAAESSGKPDAAQASEPEGAPEVAAPPKRDGQPIGRDGLTDTERASNRLDGIADELAMQVQQESSERDFAPSEIPSVIEQWAKDNKVDAGELRTRVVDRLRKRLSEGRMRQVEQALSEKKPAGPITNLEEARRVVKDGRQGKLKQSLLKSAIERAEAGDVGDLASRLAASKAEIEKQAKKSAVEEDASEAEIERLAQAIARADTARVIERKLRELNESRGTGTSSDLAWGTGGGGNYIRDLRVLERALEIANRTPPGGKIEDFGEKLDGARKDRARDLTREISDDEFAAQPLSKSWPATDVNAIEDVFVAAFAHTARASVPPKPRQSHKLKRWVESVKMLRGLAASIVSGDLPRAIVEDRLRANRALEGFTAKVDLLTRLDREHWKRITGVREYPDAYTYDSSGKKVASPNVYVEIDGKTAVIDGAGRVTDDAVLDRVNTLLGLERAEKKMAFEVRGRGSSFFINKKGDPEYRKLKQFTTSKEALDFVRSNHAELVGLWEAVKDSDNVKKADVRRAENRQRTGADRRGGLDVTPEQFEQAFGFRGVQFGDWVGQGADAKARQGMLNQAYDALHDLAEIIGVPTRAISLNGTMGLAFGARGKGWASAHFEPDNLVINLTKTRGAGSLAHEWFHALDNYFSRMRRDGEESPFTGDQYGYRRQNYITYQPEAYYEKEGRTIRARDFEAAIAAGPLQAGASREDRRNYNLRRQIGSTDGWVKRDAVRPQVEERFAALVEALKASPMAKRASTIDKGSSDGYWSRIIELGARAFETFVIARMAQKGYHNDFLANVVASDDFVRSAERYPYPKPDELAPIEQAFDDLFGTIETRETDRGLAIFEPTAQYRVGEPQDTQADLFGVPGEPGENRPARSGRAGVRRNVQPAATLSDTEAPAGEYFLRTVLGTETNRQLGASVIKTHADAARATKYLYRNAVERFDGIVTDKNGKPLAVVGGFKGALSQASVYPATLIGEAVRIPGAARIWFSHNHPSGTAELSGADRVLHRALNSVFRGSGIEPMGLLAVAGDSYAFEGTSPSGLTGDAQNNLPIYGKDERVEVPVVERMIAPDGVAGHQINSPAAAKTIGAIFYNRTKEPGLLLVSTQNRVVAWVPLSSNMLGKLRDTGGLQSLYRAVSESTVGGALIVHGGELSALPDINGVSVVENIGAALKQVDVTPLDKINVVTGHSAAEHGASLASGPVFSRRDLTSTPEFRRWFGDSKVVDENGDPLVVYHGSQKGGITAFLPGSHFGSANQANTLLDEKGMERDRLVSRPGKSGEFHRRQIESGQSYEFGETDGAVYPVYLAIRNPKRVWDAGDWGSWSEQIEQARQEGHDGLVYANHIEGNGEDSWIAFRPEQIKSATGNRGTFDPANPDIRLARGGGTGMAQAEVTRIADAVRKAWSNGPEVVVVEGMTDPRIPYAVRAEDARQRSGGAAGAPEGFFADGKVYIVASEIDSAADVVRVLFHEALGHYGLRGLYGNALNGVLDKVIEVRRAEVVAKMREYGLPNTLDGRRTAAEEVLAGLAQTQPKLNIVRAAIAAIRSWLRRVFPNLRLSNDEIARDYLIPARAWVQSGAGRPSGATAFSRGEGGTPEQFRATERAYGGREAWQRARDAGRTKLTYGQWVTVRTPAFKAWFGDWEAPRAQQRSDVSKVVDANGEPLVVYHGTQADFDTFESRSPQRVMWQDGKELKRADSWDMGDDRTGAPDAYHYLALSDAEFHSPADALRVRSRELQDLKDRNPGEPFPDSERVVRDLRRLAEGGPITKSIESRQSGVRPYFTPDKDYSFIAKSGSWGDGGIREGGNVMLVYLSIKNPIYLDADAIESAGWVWEKYAAQGYDGAIFAGNQRDLTQRGMMGGSTQIVAFDKTQIKSATGNRGTFDPENPDIRFSRKAPVWFSPLARTIEGINAKAQPASAWLAQINALTTKGVKADEIEWSGIREWLELQDGRVTKEAVLDYLSENGVRVEEVVLGEPETEDALLEREARRMLREDGIENPTDEQVAEFIEEHGYDINNVRDWQFVGQTKFGDFRVPGSAENYRELLLTLPPAGEPRFQFVVKEGGGLSFRFNGADYATEQEARAAERAARASEFRTPHWSQPNVLAHIRFDERTDADGKRVLFIQELQSDWGQSGRKRGFHSPITADTPMTAKLWDNGIVWEVSTQDGRFVSNVTSSDVKGSSGAITAEQAIAEARRRVREEPARTASRDVVPRAPFVEKTEAWVGLALKRAIRYAIDNGFDRVAIVSGEQAAKMFNLSEHVTRLYYDRDGRGYILSADGRRGEVFPRDMQYSDEELDGVVGKEIAQKIRNREGREDDENGGMILEGVDLEVGGEGMEKFYPRSDLGPVGTDKNGKPIYPIVQLVAQRVLKQLGGPALTTVQMPVPGGTGRTMEVDRGPSFGGRQTIRIADELPMAQPGFDITPAMRDTVLDQGLAMFSRAGSMGQRATDVLRSVTVGDVMHRFGNRLRDLRGVSLQALGRRQIVDVYGDLLPQLRDYDDIAQQLEAEKNEGAAEADGLADRWGRLTDERALADVMHDATLAKWDPDTSMAPVGLMTPEMRNLLDRFNALTPQAKAVYRDARDAYRAHYEKVKNEIKARIRRSIPASPMRAAMLEEMEATLFADWEGVYFPLARFGDYVIVARDAGGNTVSVSRAETLSEAEAVRARMMRALPASRGYSVGKIIKAREFNAARDGVGRSFLHKLYGVLDQQGALGAELQDSINQLYLSSLPDLSWAKHGIHRKGTPGFSQDARRAFAQNMFHGARYLAKLRHSDRLADSLMAMQDHVDEQAEVEDYDSVAGQQVVDEMTKRHDLFLNPKVNPLATMATSVGFVWYLGLSPASAIVNLSQTPLVAYPLMGAKWGFRKAASALERASRETMAAGNDLSKRLRGDELAAFERAVKDGTIDITQAHDLAGIAQGEDQGVVWRMRPIMKAAAFLFHHAEKFNRQATFLAAYRMAKDANPAITEDEAYRQAKDITYRAHFDYAAGNKPRVMQGNIARVVLLFKQFAQNMVYTLARQGVLAAKGDREAAKAFGALLTSHALAAGIFGLPLVNVLLEAASMLGSTDDEPWDAEGALRNYMAEAIGKTPGAVVAHGLSRLTPWDVSGRVGLDNLIFPDVREGLEGESWAHAAAASAAGPVLNMALIGPAKGLALIADGHWLRGLESMMPAILRSGLKSIRYASEGATTRDGKTIVEDVGVAEWLGQAAGFSPSRVRDAGKAREIVFGLDRRINARRASLIRDYGDAVMAKDHGAMGRQREAVLRFNAANPDRPITGATIVQSVRMRTMRAAEAEKGIYLPRKRRGLVEQGRFADVE